MTIFNRIACAILLLAFSSGASAQSAPPAIKDIVQISLVAGSRLPSGNHLAGLKVSLAPGWKTYWRTAGETGIPPRFDWSGSANLAHVQYHWPRPDILTVDGIRVIGFKNELVLPLEMTPGPERGDIHAVLNLELGVCSTVCIPVNTHVSADLTASADEDRFLIELAMDDQPEKAADHGLRSISCSLSKIEDGYYLRASIRLPNPSGEKEVVVVESDLPEVWVAPTASNRQGDKLIAETSLISYAGEPFSPQPGNLKMTVISKSAALEINGCPLVTN